MKHEDGQAHHASEKLLQWFVFQIIFKIFCFQFIINSLPPTKDDIIICQKLFPNLKVGDVVEIYSPEDDFRFGFLFSFYFPFF